MCPGRALCGSRDFHAGAKLRLPVPMARDAAGKAGVRTEIPKR